jgi:DNA-binding CsgD family transcriptional regulator
MNPVRDRDIPLELVNVQILDKDGSFADLPLSESLKLNYNNSTVRFRLRYPVYSGFDIRIRYRLLGLDMGWTDMGREMRMITPHLRPGNYTFVAEAYAGDEILADTSIDFVIRRAWYVSVWMMILYLLVALMIVVGVSKLSVLKANKENQRKLEHQKRKLQEQKEAMLEEDIRKKSKDLASMSLAVIAHNEVLDSILKEINEQHGNKAQSLDRIRRIVQSRLTSNNQQWEFFQSNFDRIHENFFRKLKDLYPDLTSTDMRLCALLRLNLSTKEIANMLNLTVRGVESARYRLRKKLGISEEARLTDFMINFK